MIKTLLLICGLLSSVVLAAPYEAYPIPKQLPPVARENEQFSFLISNDTYKSNVDSTVQISYNAYNLPDWLSFDSASRTIQGVPTSDLFNSDNEVNYFNFILEGTDESDQQKLNETYQLVVTNKSPIKESSNFNLLALLKNSGYTNGKNGLILTPNEVFNVTFDRSDFEDENPIVAFYGRTNQYNAPLPSWLFFDSSNLKFSGTAPVVNSNIAPQTTYDLALIVTDIDGYAGFKLPFELVIGAHTLTTSIQNTLVINVTEAGNFSYPVPLEYVYYDNEPISSRSFGDIQLINQPSWVTLDNDTVVGNVPENLLKEASGPVGNFSVMVHDINGDVIYLNMEVEATTNLFATTSLPNLNATRGEWFSYNFLPSQFTDSNNTDVSVVFPDSAQSHDWISFASQNLTLMGTVPDDFVNLTVGVVASKNSQTQQIDFNIIGMDKSIKNTTNITSSSSISRNSSLSHTSTSSSSTSATHSSTSSASLTSTSATNTATSSAVVAPVAKSTTKKSHSTAIACGVAIPLAVIAIAAIIVFMLLRKKKQDKKRPDEEQSPNISHPDPNNPANHPNQAATSLSNPFEDDNDINSAERRLDMLDALKLDEVSSTDSDTSTVNEKASVYTDALYNGSRDLLLDKKETNSTFLEPNMRSSSVYVDSIPAKSKSWRYTLDSINNTPQPGGIRDSYSSLNTISTAQLMDTTLSENNDIPKDPRKSTLGLRDSVFMGGLKNKHSMMGATGKLPSKNSLSSDPVLEAPSEKTPTTVSSSSTDDFVPIKNGTNYEWVSKSSPNRKPSEKRFVDVSTKSNINVSQVQNFEGHSPEHI
ncbi:Axial budding pattern protein 2 [Nakaseomyces bracarensis]|uniref:Axial budding pattern protein 2 n=1 Tax=Nakaseomyces bracarensis TaxID=273131 RepID=A0ABR4NTM3_9SACH